MKIKINNTYLYIKNIKATDNRYMWYINGKPHRNDGPAFAYADGYQAWYVNGKCHRTDGPAVIREDGTEEWYIRGKKLAEDEFKSNNRENHTS